MPRGVGHRSADHYKDEEEGYKWKDDLPPDYTAEELRSYLPGRKVGVKFIEWYRQDVKGRGMTVPFMKYSGPGNPTNIGEPVNEADRFAKIHDLEYAYAKFRYNNGKITEEQLKKETDAADVKFMKSNGWNITASMDPREQLASIIGALGIGVKYGTESVVGQIYPSLEKDNSFEIPTTSTNLSDKLMQNLRNNISRAQTSEQSSSMTNKAQKSETGERIETGDTGGEADLPHKAAGGGNSAAVIEDIDMAQLPGSGKEQASGGASSDGMMVHYIEKPLSIFGTKSSTYTKSHKFMTFGFAPSFCIPNSGPNGDIMLTTYLAEIPWHIPAFFLNQSEFDLIPDGSVIESVKVEVIYRGSTIQFETAQSATSLATLNQINDIAVAHGLNRTGWGSNVRYTGFNNTQPMIPTSITRPTYGPVTGLYRGMVRDYYGSNNTVAQFAEDIPKHQLGRQTFLYNYWANSSRIAVAQTPNAAMFGGWSCLAEKINQMDGKTVVNQVVASSTYKPKLGTIKNALRTQGHGLPFPIAGANPGLSVPGVGVNVNQRQARINAPNVAPSTGGVQAERSEVTYAMNNNVTELPTFNIYTPIEKSSYGATGYWNTPEQHIQPSLHVGVQPVPALSSAATLTEDTQFNNWTDTRAYWEVVATMVVREHSPTAWPYATAANVPVGENVVWAPAANRPAALVDPRNDGATFAGAYTLSSAGITT